MKDKSQPLTTDLLKLVAKRASLVSELERIERIPAQMDSEEQALLESGNFDDDATINTLIALRTKRDLVPGKIRALERAIAELDAKLAAAVEAETAALRKLAIDGLDEFKESTPRRPELKQLSPMVMERVICELVRDSTPARAIEKMRFLSSDPVIAASALINVRKLLESAETTAQPTPSTTK